MPDFIIHELEVMKKGQTLTNKELVESAKGYTI
jgi:hypothetical protein